MYICHVNATRHIHIRCQQLAMKNFYSHFTILVFLFGYLIASGQEKTQSKIGIELTVGKELVEVVPSKGRMILILSKTAEPEPRHRVSWPGEKIALFGTDVNKWDGIKPIVIDENAIGFPYDNINEMDTGHYYVQAVYDSDTTFCHINAPGNFYSEPIEIKLNKNDNQRFIIILDKKVEEETLPENRELVRYYKLQSKLLTEFWGKPMFLRAGVVLPKNYNQDSNKKYPVYYYVGGYHTRYFLPERFMWEGRRTYTQLMADSTPEMILVFLDGEAPFGDSYQMNSANNGPYADATIQELIPHIEKDVNAAGTPQSRFLGGGSTGGWVSLALQIFYPDFFNGAWSSCADPVDYRALLLTNIYEDKDNFINEYGYDRPWWRDIDGDIRFTVRDAVQFENVLGRNNTYSLSGMQWGCYNAICSPKGSDGYPMELFNPSTGEIDSLVAEHWKKYDLRLYLENNWEKIGHKLQGKIHIKMGDRDSFYLDNAMRLLEEFFESTENPKSDAEIIYGSGQGHCWGYGFVGPMEQMFERFKSAK